MKATVFSWKRPAGGERQAHSFLIRLWQEPREVEGERMAVRGYLRDLRTGEEHYVTDAKALASILEHSLEGAERAEPPSAQGQEAKDESA